MVELSRSAPKRRDPAIEPVESQREHARPENIQYQLRRARIGPRSLGLGIEPDGIPVGVDEPFKPRHAGLVVHVFHAPTRLHQLVGTHRGVADKDELPVGPVLMEDVERSGALVAPPPVVPPYVVVDAVVKVEILEVAELALCGGKQFLAYLDMRVHRAADVEEEQDLDAVAALGDEVQVEPTRILGGPFDGRIEIELLRDAFAREASQASQRDLDVARIELDRVVEIAEGPLVPDFDGASVAPAFLPDADAFRVVAVRAERARPGRADPLRAALMAATLLLQALLQRLHQLVPTTERLHQRLVLRGQIAFDELADPLLGDHGADVEYAFDTVEVRSEREIETIVERFVLDQAGARQKIEVVDVAGDDTVLQRVAQRQELARADRQLGVLEMKEEVDQHESSFPLNGGRTGWGWRTQTAPAPTLTLPHRGEGNESPVCECITEDARAGT